MAAGILTLVWPDITLYVVSILVTWYLILFGIMHMVGALAGPKLRYWWTQLLLGPAELTLGVWAMVHGVNEIFAAFSVRETGRRAERLVG